MHHNRRLLAVIILLTGLLLTQLIRAQTTTPEPINDIMVNGELVDNDQDTLPDYWFGLKLAPDDKVICKEICKFRFRGDNVGMRSLYQPMDAIIPFNRRFNFITQIKADNVAPGSFVQIVGFFNDQMTLNHIWMIPPGKQKRQIVISAVAAGGVNKLYLVIQIHGGKFKFDTASLIVDNPASIYELPDAD